MITDTISGVVTNTLSTERSVLHVDRVLPSPTLALYTFFTAIRTFVAAGRLSSDTFARSTSHLIQWHLRESNEFACRVLSWLPARDSTGPSDSRELILLARAPRRATPSPADSSVGASGPSLLIPRTNGATHRSLPFADVAPRAPPHRAGKTDCQITLERRAIESLVRAGRTGFGG